MVADHEVVLRSPAPSGGAAPAVPPPVILLTFSFFPITFTTPPQFDTLSPIR